MLLLIITYPHQLSLSRQDLRNNNSSFSGTLKGGYVLSKEKKKNIFTLIATGSEVYLAIDVQKDLLIDGNDVRIVSLPAFILFDENLDKYK